MEHFLFQWGLRYFGDASDFAVLLLDPFLSTWGVCTPCFQSWLRTSHAIRKHLDNDIALCHTMFQRHLEWIDLLSLSCCPIPCLVEARSPSEMGASKILCLKRSTALLLYPFWWNTLAELSVVLSAPPSCIRTHLQTIPAFSVFPSRHIWGAPLSDWSSRMMCRFLGVRRCLAARRLQ